MKELENDLISVKLVVLQKQVNYILQIQYLTFPTALQSSTPQTSETASASKTNPKVFPKTQKPKYLLKHPPKQDSQLFMKAIYNSSSKTNGLKCVIITIKSTSTNLKMIIAEFRRQRHFSCIYHKMENRCINQNQRSK